MFALCLCHAMQLQFEKEQRKVMAQRLSEERKKAEKAQKEIMEAWEEKLKKVEMEKIDLSQQLQKMGADKPQDRVLRGGTDVRLTQKELKQLRKDIQEQETLIKGYQMENERMVERLREMQAEMKENERRTKEDNTRLAATLASHHIDYSRKSADAASHFQRILNLEAELERVKQEAHARELELKFELDKARKGRKELENRIAGIDPEQMAKEDAALEETRAQLTKEREEHAKVVKEMERKLQWYAENQELIDQINQVNRQQAATITQLQTCLAEYDKEDADVNGIIKGNVERSDSKNKQMNQNKKQGSRGGGAFKVQASSSHIAALQKQVKSLEAALQEIIKSPNSLTALVQASRPPPEENELIVKLKSEVASLNAICTSTEEQSNKALRSLRQEHERICMEYQRRIKALKQQIIQHPKPALARAGSHDTERALPAGRTKRLEQQLEECRTFYSKKVKELSKKLAEATSEKTKEDGGGIQMAGAQDSLAKKTKPNGLTAGASKEVARLTERVLRLQEALEVKDAALKALKKRLPKASLLPDVQEVSAKPHQSSHQLDANTNHVDREGRDDGSHHGHCDRDTNGAYNTQEASRYSAQSNEHSHTNTATSYDKSRPPGSVGQVVTHFTDDMSMREVREQRIAVKDAKTPGVTIQGEGIVRHGEERKGTTTVNANMEMTTTAGCMFPDQMEAPQALIGHRGTGDVCQVKVMPRRPDAAEIKCQMHPRSCAQMTIERGVLVSLPHHQVIERMQAAQRATLAMLPNCRNGQYPSEEMRAQVENLQIQCKAYDHKVKSLEEKVDILTSKLLSASPEMTSSSENNKQVQALREQLRQMQADLKQGEMRWKQMIMETQKMGEKESELLRSQLANTIKAKNVEIQRFREELDDVINTAHRLIGDLREPSTTH
ncbi:hypothetical protein CBR_g33943 [Chara braunii]|uniref:Centrosomal protein of 162 kDa n=1 Tax=Chara braunii TaxID=69332 RepID=A0A388LHP1_CHABU|nr:hypothetical protein CBR_g33943 [Chara braunii]|eukprot:GBG81765.1 hypothetical protein CBR_g33943 [Chara braunii]